MGEWLPLLSLAGTATSAYGQFQTGQNAKDVYEYNQQAAKYQSKYAQQRGEIEATKLEREGAKAMSRKRAIAGASGTVTGAGSNLDSLLNSQREIDLDAALIRYNANVDSYVSGQQADLFGAQADQFSQAGYLNAGATLLGGASKWDWKKKKSPLATYASGPPVAHRRPERALL